MLLGAHVSIAGGIWNAPRNAENIGCEVFQMFSRSPQGGTAGALDSETVKKFRAACEQHKQAAWYIHAPYFINFASKNNRIRYGSINLVRDELERGTLLGAQYVMAHLGSFKDLGQGEGMRAVIEGLSKMLDGYHGTTKFLIEIAAGSGHIIGDTFNELASIIRAKELKKYKIGVCFDTQHAFASGYDLRTRQAIDATLNEFNDVIGLEFLKLSHCNDSLCELGAKKDRHEHIGRGHIGKEGFVSLLSHPKLTAVNFILETEHSHVKKDLQLLKKMRIHQ